MNSTLKTILLIGLAAICFGAGVDYADWRWKTPTHGARKRCYHDLMPDGTVLGGECFWAEVK